MCPPFSCCDRRSPGLLPTLLYYLGRLLLAGATPGELSPGQRQRLPARLQVLWHRWHCQPRRQGPALLSEHLLAELLERACCQQALRLLVPVQEALLGPNRRRWQRQLRRRMQRLVAAGGIPAGNR